MAALRGSDSQADDPDSRGSFSEHETSVGPLWQALRGTKVRIRSDPERRSLTAMQPGAVNCGVQGPAISAAGLLKNRMHSLK